jgi:peroxiredoxin Q/BCP
VIVGASFDSVEAQKNFADSNSFPYSLISDTSREIGKVFEADQEDKSTPRRISYLIDPDGVIVKTYDLAGQDLSAHATEVLEDIRAAST